MKTLPALELQDEDFDFLENEAERLETSVTGVLRSLLRIAREQRDLAATSRLEQAFAVLDVPDDGISDGAEQHDRYA